MKRFAPALLLVLAILGTAPVMGVVRDVLFELFPRSALRSLAIGLGALAAGVFLYALSRIREHRLARYSGLLAVGSLLVLQSLSFGVGQPRVDVVEKIHLVEYGLLAYLLYRALRPLADLSVLLFTLLGVSFAGTLEEAVQWFVPDRQGEVRDVLLNVFAGFCGLLFSFCLEPVRLSGRLTAARRRQLARSTALVILTLGLFFYAAHLGYEIEDPKIGRFRSWFTADELREKAVERTRSWATVPPTGDEVWGKEDYFLTEAGWHATHRNASYEAGDFYSAWQTNRILEKYYTPFLDIDSFRDSGKHRYPPAVRREVRAKARASGRIGGGYLSPVLSERVYTWPSKPAFLVVLGVVVLGVWRGIPGRTRIG